MVGCAAYVRMKPCSSTSPPPNDGISGIGPSPNRAADYQAACDQDEVFDHEFPFGRQSQGVPDCTGDIRSQDEHQECPGHLEPEQKERET